MPSPILEAIQAICEEKNLPQDKVLESLEFAMAKAYAKDFGEDDQNPVVVFDPDSGHMDVYDDKEIIEKPLINEETGEEYYDEKKQMLLSDAKEIDDKLEVGSILRRELPLPGEFGRMAAQTAKQVIMQKLREAEKDMVFTAYKDHVGELMPGTIARVEGRMVFVDLGRGQALLPPSEQLSREIYRIGQRLKVYIISADMGPKGPEIKVSRTHPEMVRMLFRQEVPEMTNGFVEIKAVAREAGSRTKVAVASNVSNVDAVGACVGQRGTRVQAVIQELGGEKLDIIEWSEEPAAFVAQSLSPAKVISVELDDVNRIATVEVKPDQMSLAIGKGGQNVRLAHKLCNWKIDIKGLEEFVSSTEGEELLGNLGVDALNADAMPEEAAEDITTSHPDENRDLDSIKTEAAETEPVEAPVEPTEEEIK